MLILSCSSILLFVAVLAGVATAAPAPLEVHRGAVMHRMRRHHRRLWTREHGTVQLECKVLSPLQQACNHDVPPQTSSATSLRRGLGKKSSTVRTSYRDSCHSGLA